MMKMHKSIHSQKFAEKRRKKRQMIAFLVLLCVLTLTASLILILRVPFLQIKTIAVQGSTYRAPQTISATALSSLDNSYFKIIPFSNTLFYSKKAVKGAIENNFKEVKEVSVSRMGFSGLELNIIERNPAALVCAGFHADAEDDECYLSDEKGLLFAAAASSSPVTEKLYRYYVPTETGTTTIGYTFIPEKRFEELQNFLTGAAKGGLVPLGILIGEKGEYEMYIKSKKGDAETTVYFDDRSSFEKTLGNLLTFWQNSDQTQKTGGSKDFDYINLRFGNTVYYSTQ